MATLRFRLRDKAGPHRQDGRRYTAGDVIETDVELDKHFPNKFDRLEEAQAVPLAPTPPPPPAKNNQDKDWDGEPVKKGGKGK